jgi:hypothetical protein
MKKELKTLEKYENHFRTAIKFDYYTALWQADFDIIVPIYRKWTKDNNKIILSCGKCRLDFIKKMGELYFKNKEIYGERTSGETTKGGRKGKEDKTKEKEISSRPKG